MNWNDDSISDLKVAQAGSSNSYPSKQKSSPQLYWKEQPNGIPIYPRPGCVAN
jgi:hypothetical protein